MKIIDEAPLVCCAPGAPLLPTAAAERLAARFKALADPARVAILNRLARAESDTVCVCELVPPLGLSQPTVSHHLRILREAGLVTAERRGTWAFYRLVPEAVSELAFALSGETERVAAAASSAFA
ncbi:MAG: metalloregulator ArsR/SmtB family transcription factor [Actinomycetota bacterium]|nr:metalloregulator ArsR/SmtB family transcription factor [Actinomycetota bacterium]